MARCLRLRRVYKLIRKYFLCFCFHKPNSIEDTHVNSDWNTGDQDIIRLPVATNVQSYMARPGTMTLERWTSAPTFINIPPPTQFQLPLPPLSDRPRKKLSSPGRLDLSLIDQIKGELKQSDKISGEHENSKDVKDVTKTDM